MKSSIVLLLLPLLMECVNSNYETNRAQVLLNEKRQSIASGIKLKENEEDMAKYIKTLKQKEYYEFDEEKFLPAQDFLEVKDKITKSSLFPVLQAMPKGASLHTHILAATDVNYIVKDLSYMDNLYMYQWNGKLKLKFMNETAAEEFKKEDATCKRVADARKVNKDFDVWLIKQLTVTVEEKTKSARWNKLSAVFTALYDLLTYRPVFEKYLLQALNELQSEHILFAEFRGTFMEFYELNGHKYDVMESLKIMSNVINKFTTNNTEFIGAKYIYAPYRKLDLTALHDHVKLLKEAHRKFPNLVIGFDMVGMEDAGGYLKEYVEELQHVHKDIKFYFHAGETNWHGTSTDLNILDAILLRSSRIGHGLSLIKHPEMLRLVRDSKIAIEVAPVSNQVLKYVNDLRNHPAGFYAAYGIHIVICNDDPTAFGNVGLAYDYYLAFMSMTHVDEGLEFLKATALNSIGYSAMNQMERRKAYAMFDEQWNQFTGMMTALKSMFKIMLRNT